MVEDCLMSRIGAELWPLGDFISSTKLVIAGVMSSVIQPSAPICGVTASTVPTVMIETRSPLCCVPVPPPMNVVWVCWVKKGRSVPTFMIAV